MARGRDHVERYHVAMKGVLQSGVHRIPRRALCNSETITGLHVHLLQTKSPVDRTNRPGRYYIARGHNSIVDEFTREWLI